MTTSALLARPSGALDDADSIDLVADLRERLDEAYTDLIGHTRELSAQINAEFDLKADVESERNAVLLANADDPKKMGANEAAREAYLRARLRPGYERLEAATKAVQWRRQDQEIARLRVEQLRAELRCWEVTANLAGERGEN